MRSPLFRQNALRRAAHRFLVAAVGLTAGFDAGSGQVQGQVVLLPAVRTFGTSGAVSVPDQGSVMLGGSSSARATSNVQGGGVLPNRSASAQAGAGSVSVSATVIDLQAMDEAILNQASAGAAATAPNYNARATGTPVVNTLTPHLYAQRVEKKPVPARDPNAWQMALGTPPNTQDGMASAIVKDESDVRFYMLRAHEAMNAGHVAAARVYYRMAYQRLTPEQRARLHEAQQRAEAAASGAASETSGEGAQANTPPAGP